jgi:hypothetical protein
MPKQVLRPREGNQETSQFPQAQQFALNNPIHQIRGDPEIRTIHCPISCEWRPGQGSIVCVCAHQPILLQHVSASGKPIVFLHSQSCPRLASFDTVPTPDVPETSLLDSLHGNSIGRLWDGAITL